MAVGVNRYGATGSAANTCSATAAIEEQCAIPRQNPRSPRLRTDLHQENSMRPLWRSRMLRPSLTMRS